MNQGSRLSLVEGTGPETLPDTAASEVLIMSADTSAASVGEFRRIAHANLRAGVPCRALFPDSARLSGTVRALALAGAQVRTDTEVPMDALVLDRRSVVLPAERPGTGIGSEAPGGGAPGAGRSPGSHSIAAFRLPGMVTATAGLFERAWRSAVPLGTSDLPERADDQMLTARERDLLVLLCSGTTDESAAVQLGISVRTVGRMVADIMNRLGARSRFQAGAKAVDRGWLLAEAG
ncbi:helix-turn-helix transcriptional regulator [Amycolatopsis benzoatilytica]|uniref:helix-turn-helix transcriptional regulator n=1 Tax=Amycolatopsis benzoatilytica TaxID=346045 RepID=UPI000363EC57|nr:LuxR C-terminal-related transcriptional regulator [Amycolatopsis benzoatilytica]